MTNRIFNKKNIEILNPYAIESLYHLGCFIKDKNLNIELDKLKNSIIEIFKYMLENNIISVLEESFMENKNFDTLNVSNKEQFNIITQKVLSIKDIDELYDFYWFKYQNWYRSKLENLGLNYESNWINFLDNKAISLEKWIEQNKPK